jgi:acyl-CoA thioesterase I
MMSKSGNLWGRLASRVIMLLALAAPLAARAEMSSAEFCLSVNRDLSLGTSLPRTTTRLREGGPVKIVAIGSSSTKGLWMLNPADTYPQVMKRELERLWPGTTIEVVNSGRVGDTIPGNLNRFERDVLAYRPDLVIWQLGTNDVAWGGNTDGLRDKILNGLQILKAGGSDVVLMDLQYAPQVLASPHSAAMEAMISAAAREESAGLFSRFALMRQSVEAGLPGRALVALDGLHNSRDGYDCVGRALARAIDAAAH